MRLSMKNVLSFYLFIFQLGTLLRRLENGLRGVSHVIVDEIHERDINVSNCDKHFSCFSCVLFQLPYVTSTVMLEMSSVLSTNECLDQGFSNSDVAYRQGIFPLSLTSTIFGPYYLIYDYVPIMSVLLYHSI